MHQQVDNRSDILFIDRVSEAAWIPTGYGSAGVEVMEAGNMVWPFAREN